MDYQQARAALETLEIEQTNLGEKEMVGFVAGWKLAAATEIEEIAQGVVDRLNELLDAEERVEFHLGKMVGYAHYWQSLLQAMK